jgi:hypothetical protein
VLPGHTRHGWLAKPPCGHEATAVRGTTIGQAAARAGARSLPFRARAATITSRDRPSGHAAGREVDHPTIGAVQCALASNSAVEVGGAQPPQHIHRAHTCGRSRAGAHIEYTPVSVRVKPVARSELLHPTRLAHGTALSWPSEAGSEVKPSSATPTFVRISGPSDGRADYTHCPETSAACAVVRGPERLIAGAPAAHDGWSVVIASIAIEAYRWGGSS